MRTDLLLFYFLIIICSCKSDHEKLIGHWHIYDSRDGIYDLSSYTALDIFDNTIVHYNSWGADTLNTPTAPFQYDTLYFRSHNGNGSRYSLQNDSLRLEGGYWLDAIAVRFDNCSFTEDRFGDLLVKINLPYSQTYETIKSHPFDSHIAIGWPQESACWLPKGHTVIQTNDVIIGPQGIELFMLAELDKQFEIDQPKVKIYLNMDSLTLMSTVDSVRYEIHKAYPNQIYYSVMGDSTRGMQYGLADLDLSCDLYDQALLKEYINQPSTYFDSTNWNYNLLIEIHKDKNINARQFRSYLDFITYFQNRERLTKGESETDWESLLESTGEQDAFSVTLVYENDNTLQDYISIASKIRATYNRFLEQKSMSMFGKGLTSLNPSEKSDIHKHYPYQVEELSDFELTALNFSQ